MVTQSVCLACGRSGFEPDRDRPKSLKQVVTAQELNARQQLGVSSVLGDYPCNSSCTWHAKEPTTTAQCP